MIVLKNLPAGFLNGLPDEDRLAIQAMIGKPVKRVGDSFGQIEIEFIDENGDCHTIWVNPTNID